MGGLIDLECTHCQGEGYLLWTGSPGDFSHADATFLPSEGLVTCPECDGKGELEVCAECLSQVTVQNGEEVCVCTSVGLARAA